MSNDKATIGRLRSPLVTKWTGWRGRRGARPEIKVGVTVGLEGMPDESGGGVADGPDRFSGPTERVAAASWVASWRAVRVAAPDGTLDATEVRGVTEAEAICGTGEAAAAGL
jgi:hypothetical protein